MGVDGVHAHAVQRGRPSTAMVYLSEVRDTNTEGLMDVVQLMKEKQAQK